MSPRLLLLLLLTLPAASAGQAPATGAEVRFYVRTSGLFDSNLDHESDGQRAFGGMAALGLSARDGRDRPTLEVAYEVAAHRYSAPTRLQRLSHHGEFGLNLRPARWLTLRSMAEVGLRGSSEDRDLSNEYSVDQRAEFRFTRGTALRLTGAWRLRQYPDSQDVGRGATGRYAEAELRQRLPGGGRLSLGARLERNDAESSRYDYGRTTWSVDVETAPGRVTQLAIELKFRDQRYRSRRVGAGSRQERRHDWRLQPSIAGTVRPWRTFDLTAGYGFETRRSNDAGKAFSAHLVSLVLTRWW